MDADKQIQVELPFIRQYKSGNVEFLKGDSPYVPPTIPDPATGVSSKDVVIDSQTGVLARLYLPKLKDNNATKLPILIYFHGGGFFAESAFNKYLQTLLNVISSQSNILTVSVEYRLAPCHPLPAAYDDSLAALKWVLSNEADDWLIQHGDFKRVFFAGDSAGANIAHNLAMRRETKELAKIEGVALLCPYFWGSKPIGEEGKEPLKKIMIDSGWALVTVGSNIKLDDPRVNPIAEGAPSLTGLGCERATVHVAGVDYLRWRGCSYYEGLVGSGWGGKKELKVYPGMDHVFFMKNLEAEQSVKLLANLAAFFNFRAAV